MEVSRSQTSLTCDDKLFHSFILCFGIILQTHSADPAGLSPEINSKVNSFFLVIIHSQLPFHLDETNLQAAFDKLIFVELAIFVDIKLVEHHLRILLCSVLEKYSADGVNPDFKANRVALRQHPLRHYIVHQLVLRKSHII